MDLQTILILFLVISFFFGIVVIFFLWEKLNKNNSENKSGTAELIQKMISEMRTENRETLQNVRQDVQRELSESRKMQFSSSRELNERLDKSAQVISSVQKQLGEVGEATKQMHEVGKNIASLQDILRSPKLRGNFGEILLENLLEQMLPGRYEMQYTFKTGERADAILKLKEDKIVAIDSKFPLEDFQRLSENKNPEEQDKMRRALVNQTKKHVDAVNKKYILPGENTLDFAFLYVPAENVYYELTTNNDNILDYAWKKKIFIVSPNSFYAYLVTVLQGLRALEIEKNIVQVQQNISKLNFEFGKFGEDFVKIGTHLRHATGSFELSEKRFDKFSTALEKTLDGQASTKLVE